MKIAFVSTSFREKYNKCLESLISSAFKHLKHCDTFHYYAVSDQNILGSTFTYIQSKPYEKSALIKCEKLRNILLLENILQEYDYIYCIDTDCIFLNDTNIMEILPESEDSLVCTPHPWQVYNENKWLLEQRSYSSAYLENTDVYIQSCFFGGSKKYMLQMLKEVDSMIEEDLKKNFNAVWFDESYINKYMYGRKKTLLKTIYNFPEKMLTEENKKHVKIVHFNSYSEHVFSVRDKTS